MPYLVFKFAFSALLIVAVSEVAKRSGVLGGALASLPLVSVLSLIWLYRDTQDLRMVINLSHTIFWFVLPSLLLFVVFPILLKRGVPFYGALGLACGVTVLESVVRRLTGEADARREQRSDGSLHKRK